MTLRVLAATGLAVALLAAAPVPAARTSAAADSNAAQQAGASSGPKAAPYAASQTIGDGTVLLILKHTGEGRLTRARAVAAQPCVAYTVAGSRVQVCVDDDDRAKVRTTGDRARKPFLVPVTVDRASRRSVTFVLRRADVSLPVGKGEATAWCDDCRPTTRPARVFPLRMRQCVADGPWLVHGAPRPIGKAVAVTFDDGPDAITDDILRILKREGVLATFFQVGVMIQQRPDILARIVKDGHVIGNHTWSHPVMHAGAGQQLSDVQRLVRKLTGIRPCVFRAPYGENPPSVVDLARSKGLVTVHWNVDPGDWRGASADSIVHTALSQTRPGSIMVLHDGGNHRAVLAALPRYLDELRRRHYRFLTVPELLRLPVRYVD